MIDDFRAAMASYEAAMRVRLGPLLVESDLDDKHRKMAEDPFQFLRATCWRWAQTARTLCPKLFIAAAVPSVGDAHAGNFGLWREANARLVWGVNDYDEAAMLPWPLDLVRLGASIALADAKLAAAGIAKALLGGYADALSDPEPFILERDHLDIRDAFTASDKKRAKFWRELDDAPDVAPPDDARALLRSHLPADIARLRFVRRSAGIGSLGRARFVAYGDVGGGPIASEVKARLPSCWNGDAALPARILAGATRSPDPLLRYDADWVVRRLAPDSGKIDFAAIKPKLQRTLIAAMGAELAGVHSALAPIADKIALDRARLPKDWLARATVGVANDTRAAFALYRSQTEPS